VQGLTTVKANKVQRSPRCQSPKVFRGLVRISETKKKEIIYPGKKYDEEIGEAERRGREGPPNQICLSPPK